MDYIPCDVCGMAVPTFYHRDQHLENLRPLVGVTAACLLCGRQFIEDRALRQHLNHCRSDVKQADLLNHS